jgi:hypothetical protein
LSQESFVDADRSSRIWTGIQVSAALAAAAIVIAIMIATLPH